MGGKRQRPLTAGEKIKYEEAGSGRSAATKMVRIAQSPQRRHCDARRTNGKAEERAEEDNQSQSREGKRVASPASAAKQGHRLGTGGPVQEEMARKKPPSDGVSANLVTTPSKVVSPETPSLADDTKLRPPDNSQRHLYPCQARRWFAAAEPPEDEKIGLLGTAAERGSSPASPETRALATVTTKGGHGGAPGSAAPGVQPVEGVPQPLSVVAVWSRPPSQRETARKDESLPPRAGVSGPSAVRSSVDTTAEGPPAIGSDCHEISRPLHSTTPGFREAGPSEAPLERGAVCR